MSAAFAYVVRGDEIVITHHGKKATVLRGGTAERFLEDVKAGDPQALMARVT
ncbi:MAG: hypothetical protein H0T09_05340, partial [Actinobacteria bacterium]|nr:hypothetical protein [Actinomycetota bacterium]